MKDALVIAQCQANIRALLSLHGLPQLETQGTLVDRTLFKRTDAFIARMEELASGKIFRDWPFNQEHGTTAKRGWREAVACFSLQVIEHTTNMIECDVDLMNPDFGLGPALGHFVECLWPGKTESFRVMRGLRRRGIPVPDVREIQEV